MSVYYTVWSTWKEDAAQTPWEFWTLTTPDKLKPRKNSGKYAIISKAQVTAAFEKLDSELLENIEQNYIEGCKLAAFIIANSTEESIAEVQRIFEDAEFEKCTMVDAGTQAKIIELFTQAMNEFKN